MIKQINPLIVFILCTYSFICASNIDFEKKIIDEFNQGEIRTGIVLIVNLKDGRKLSSVEYVHGNNIQTDQLAFGNTFPAASLFKIVVAVSALEYNSDYLNKKIPFRGSHHSLKPWQIDIRKKSQKININDAFATSSNPAFGVLGISIGLPQIILTAKNMGFSELGPSKFILPKTKFGEAQFYSGYTKNTTISPIHAAEIIRALADDGRFFKIDSGHFLANKIISEDNLSHIQEMMERTIVSGTAKKGFNDVKGVLVSNEIKCGGKTGTLRGNSPEGLYDWFAGYAKDKNGNGIVIVSMIIHSGGEKIKSSKLSSKIIEFWITQKKPILMNQ